MNNQKNEKEFVENFKKKIIKNSKICQKDGVKKKNFNNKDSAPKEMNIYKHLDKARENASIGVELPSFKGFNIFKRFFYRWIIRFLFKVLRVITINQNHFNLSVIEILRNNTDYVNNIGLQSANDRTQLNTKFLEQELKIANLDGKFNETSKVLDYVKNRLTQLDQKVNDVLNDRNGTNIGKKEYEEIKGEINHDLDSLYVFLTDNLRGSCDEIKERLKVYVPIIKKAQIGTEDSSILDIGCGRGEWLELMKEQELSAVGLDLNQIMIKTCKDLELNVIEGEALSFLGKNKDNSFGAVTGFHLIEHYEFESLNKLFSETFRVLKPGGLAIFETPNPENILVGSNTFYLDPYHRKPLPGLLVRLLMEANGFNDITIKNLHPGTIPLNEDKINEEHIKIFRKYFSGPQDYAVIGYKR